MSEEKPVLKVTDRRLFNPDGSPRDIERIEKTNATAATPDATGDAAAALASSANASQANPSTPNAAASTLPVDAESAPPLSAAADVAPPPPSSSSPQSARTAPAEKERQTAATNPAVEPAAQEDPTAFVNLLMFIASPAAAALGLTEHPGIAADETDLPLAKHCIDLLGTLRQKTKGNVTGQEDEIFENLLAELRMQFVSLSGVRGAAASGGSARGGFSGSDITGGGGS
jgi:hypothetical protein